MDGDYIYLAWMIPAAYLLGSIPTAVWVGRIFFGIDVRQHGSGNAGATNVMRVLGVKTGLPVLLLDMLKGWFAVRLLHFQGQLSPTQELFGLFSIVLGILAVTGHIFPLFAGFRGGKGVATITGVCLAILPLAAVSALGVFVVVLLLSRYVSVSSMSAGVSFPFWVIFVYQDSRTSLIIFSILAAIILLITHRKNISRLINGEESKAGFLFKRSRK